MRNTIFFIILISVVWTGCDSDFLDRPPKDNIDAEFFFNTPKDLEVATNDFYTMLPTESLYKADASSDNVITLNPSDKVRGARIVPTGRGSGGWSWRDLRGINFFLEHYDKVEDEAAKKHYSGVARFFRALFYFQKVQRFGDVPWYNKVLEADDEDLYKPRDSRQLVMDSVMADIDYARSEERRVGTECGCRWEQEW